MTSIEKRQMCTEIAYTALKNGGGCVRVLSKKEKLNSGFDLESREGERKDYIGVKIADKKGKFTISSAEYKAMNSSNDESEYVIHSYYVNNGKIESFSFYRFNKDSQLLVDELDNRNVCALQSRVLDNEGISTTVYDCIPMKKKKIVK